MLRYDNRDDLEKLAMSFTQGVNHEIITHLNECGISLSEFFKLPTKELSESLNLRPGNFIQQAYRDEALDRARREMTFMQKHGIRAYFINDNDYPLLLKEISDPPVVLYQLGSTNLDASETLNMVGTRKATPLGLDWVRKTVADLGGYFPEMILFSGLAYGVDAAAHNACLEGGYKTVGVVAHGLDSLYPAAHRDLARRMIKAGGSIVTEYPSGVKAFRNNFLARNRIIAGLSELTIIVESEIKGGAMSTANYAFNYNRELMAVPGRASDPISAGCNLLIRKEKARLVCAAADIVEVMNWTPANINVNARQRNLFPELTGEIAEIYEIIKFEKEPVSIDVLRLRTGIKIPHLVSLLSEMEYDGIILRHPGNRISLA